ncbi:hypothetical protein A6A27_38645 [Micromonospora sp. CB01531]|nr:hypothetical protein A6A27_38645 [Micromonospora sp. CB01531]
MAPITGGGWLPLRGRDEEMRLIRDQLHALTQGRGGTVLIEGAPGSGKSRLLAEALGLARRGGIRARLGAGTPDGHAVPFAPLWDALLAGPGPLLNRSLLQRLTDSPDQRFWLLQELQNQLEQVATAGPLVIAMDDVHWCDTATLTALRTLPLRLGDQPILWLLASRERSLTQRWSPDIELRLRLRPLSGDAVERLAQDVLGAVAEPALLTLARRADGRPLLLVELLRGLREEGAVVDQAGVACLIDDRIPTRFHSSVRRRLDPLSPQARDLVQIAAVLSRTVDVEILAELTGQPPVELIAPLREATEADLLAERDGQLVFRHDLIREAVRGAVPAALARSLRRHAVEVRLQHGAAAMEVASDLAATAEPGDRHAVALLRRAAADFAPTSPSTAVELSQRAMELAPADDPDNGTLIAETIMLLWLDGRDVEARALADSTLAGLLEPEAEGAVRLSLARLSSQYSFIEAVRQCRTALELPGLPPALRAQLFAVQALCLAMVGDIAETARVTELALEAAEVAGDRMARATAVAVGSTVAFYMMDWERAFRLQDDAVRLATDEGAVGSLWVPEACWTAFLHNAAGRTELALKEADAGLRAAQQHGQAAGLCFWSMNRTRVLLDAGRLADARAEADGVLAMVDDLGARNFAEVTALYVLGRIAIHTGDRDGIRRCTTDGERMMRDEAPVIRRAGAWMAALAADSEGDFARVLELTEEAAETFDLPDPSLGMPLDPADEVVFARVALRAGDRERAERAVLAAERRARLNPGFPFLAGVAAHARGLLDGDIGLLVRAVDLLAGFPRPLVHASALEDAGRALVASRAMDAAARLEAALGLYEQAGAVRDAARVRSRLREVGVRRRGRACGGTLRGWQGLTGSELQVVRLVAQGATNRQVAERLFLSPHTISTHLRHAYTKLEIKSRVELARLVLEQDG